MNKIISEDIDHVLKNCPFIKDKLNNSSILITGATGMLPSYMVYTLQKIKENDADFNIELYIGARNVKKARQRFGTLLDKKWVHLWQANLNQTFEFPFHVDYIVHAASLASSDLYLTNPVEVILPNTIALYSLLEIAKREITKGFLFFSSCSVYGLVEGKNLITESDSGYLLSTDVRSCYAESKRLGETLCAAYAAEYKIKTTCIRPAHTYGPTMNLNDSRVFAEFVKNIVENHNIEMKSDGCAKRAFCYLSDATDAFWRILLLGKSGETYNLCNTDCFCSISELADIMCSLYPEKHLNVIRVQRRGEDSYSEDKNANLEAFSNEKLKALEWNPKVGIREGFKRTIDSFLS